MSLQVSLQVSLPWELIDSDSSALHKIQTAQICTVIHHIHHIDMGSTYISHTARLKVWRTHTSKTFISSTRRASSRSTVSQQTYRYNRIQDKAERERVRESRVKSENVCVTDTFYTATPISFARNKLQQTPRTTQNMATSGRCHMKPASLSQVASQHHEENNALQGRWDRFDLTSWIFLIHGPKRRWIKMNQNESIRQPVFIDLH